MTLKAKLYYEDVDFGDDIDPLERVVTDDMVRRFLGIRGQETGPNRFTNDASAMEEGLPNAIVPGAMNVAMISQLLTAWSPSVTLRKLDVVFRQPVPHNAPIQIKGVVTDKVMVDSEPRLECDVFLEDSQGSRLVIGTATVVLPSREA